MRLRNVAESVALAFGALRSNLTRSALTILGVVIGVATVMAVNSIVDGVRTQIFNALKEAGPTTFYVMRYFTLQPLSPEQLPREVRIRPVLDVPDAEAIRRLPEISYASLWVQLTARLAYLGERTQMLTVYGADDNFIEVLGGVLVYGRSFTRSQLKGAPVVVLELESAARLFGSINPLGKYLEVGGKPLLVVGIYQRPANIFEPPGQQIGAVIPFETARQHYRYDNTNSLFIAVKPRPGVSADQAQDLTSSTLRRTRKLRPEQPNTFDLLTQDKLFETVSTLTSVFFAVMIGLSSVALLVGGVGVSAVMMVSVASRTQEIGIRRAVGASRQDILWQFLIEAATLTLTGGLLGVLAGLGLGEVLKHLLRIEAALPLPGAVVAILVSITLGLIFGLYPAGRAARMDPVEALRHE